MLDLSTRLGPTLIVGLHHLARSVPSMVYAVNETTLLPCRLIVASGGS
jgi:hypothetical protein